MKIQPLALFPTNITHTIHEVTKDEQENWFDLYFKHCGNDGRTHDLLGYEQVQLEPSLEGFYENFPVFSTYELLVQTSLHF